MKARMRTSSPFRRPFRSNKRPIDWNKKESSNKNRNKRRSGNEWALHCPGRRHYRERSRRHEYTPLCTLQSPLRHSTPNPLSFLSGLTNQPNQTSKMMTRKMTLTTTIPLPGLTTTKMTAVKDRISSSQITKTCPTLSVLTRVVFPRTISTSAKGNDQPSNVPIFYHAEFQH